MVTFHKEHTSDFPRRKKRLAWYAEAPCLKLLQKDQITEEDEKSFWVEIDKKKTELPFQWQKEYLDHEAKKALDHLKAEHGY